MHNKMESDNPTSRLDAKNLNIDYDLIAKVFDITPAKSKAEREIWARIAGIKHLN